MCIMQHPCWAILKRSKLMVSNDLGSRWSAIANMRNAGESMIAPE